MTAETFPLTDAGLEITVQYACRNAGVTTPRDLQKAMDDLFNRAIDEDRHILSSAYVTGLVSG